MSKEKDGQPLIVTITANEYRCFGLGSDNKLYRWDLDSEKWVSHRRVTYEP